MKNRQNYPPHWFDTIRPAILARDRYKCKACGLAHRAQGFYSGDSFIECSDEHERSWAKAQGRKVQRVFLQIAHIDQNPSNNNYENLQAMCPRCHLKFDNSFNSAKRLMKRKK
jgi:5-methylcytosine-specific restriction endonuclease McrA